MSDQTLAHPTLRCSIRGKASTTTTQFRNLKYATIPGRWIDSIPNDTLGTGVEDVFDATTFGPSCQQKRGGQAWDLTLLGNIQMPLQMGHRSNEEEMDEFECLNINVTVPKTTLDQQRNAGNTGGKGLPVFVWVHGGGMSIGSNSWPQYDLTRFVERSVEIGRPVIGVAMNYRVGILGYLASEELGSEGNFGYKDQVLAFKWVKKHIAGFGGDPKNITAAGESAGGISLSTLLCADVGDEGLFERVVIMSGEATLRKTMNKTWHEKMYHDQLKLLELDNISVKERTRRLREMSAEELADKLPMFQHFCACVDGKFLNKNITTRILSDGKQKEGKPDWCKEFVIGDTAHDGSVLKARILDKPESFALLQSLCASHLTSAQTTSLLSAYKLPAPTPILQQFSLLTLSSELRFYLPALAVSTGWRNKDTKPPIYSRCYHFHVSNPFEGPFKGRAAHELDVAYLLGNFAELMDGMGKNIGRQMADRWIGFVNGEGWCKEGSVVVVGNEGVLEVEEAAYDETFRNGRGSLLLSIGAERLWEVAEGWQGVRREERDDVRGRL